MKTCKKCGKALPDGHKGHLCEGCMGKRVQGIKKTGKAILSVCIAVGGTALAIVTKGAVGSGKS